MGFGILYDDIAEKQFFVFMYPREIAEVNKHLTMEIFNYEILADIGQPAFIQHPFESFPSLIGQDCAFQCHNNPLNNQYDDSF